MTEMIKEERYIFLVGTTEHVLRVQELVWGSTAWPQKFRIEVPASFTRTGKKFYGATAREAIERATQYLTSPFWESSPSPQAIRVPN